MLYKGYIFDLDGTLVDSAHDYQAIRAELGLAQGEPILEAIASWESQERAKAHEIIHRHELRGAQASTLIPGVIDFLNFLSEHDKPVAIFTRNSRNVTLATLEKHDLKFSQIISRDDAAAKPAPDGLSLIATSWGFSSSQILYVGDYLYDLQAGLAASMPTALYLSAPADFDTTGCVISFSHYSQLQRFVNGKN